MVNELLCKILANNLTVLIQEQEELCIAPEFWKDDEPEADDDGPRLLRFPGA